MLYLESGQVKKQICYNLSRAVNTSQKTLISNLSTTIRVNSPDFTHISLDRNGQGFFVSRDSNGGFKTSTVETLTRGKRYDIYFKSPVSKSGFFSAYFPVTNNKAIQGNKLRLCGSAPLDSDTNYKKKRERYTNTEGICAEKSAHFIGTCLFLLNLNEYLCFKAMLDLAQNYKSEGKT